MQRRSICVSVFALAERKNRDTFVADIEAPTAEMNTPADRYFEALGFRRPYFRSHYGY
jgi:hypothetical protein